MAARKTIVRCFNVPPEGMTFAYDPQECDVKHSPDYCSGWAYVTTPALGLRLAEMAANVDPGKMCLRLEDLFITGMLRERIQGEWSKRS